MTLIVYIFQNLDLGRLRKSNTKSHRSSLSNTGLQSFITFKKPKKVKVKKNSLVAKKTNLNETQLVGDLIWMDITFNFSYLNFSYFFFLLNYYCLVSDSCLVSPVSIGWYVWFGATAYFPLEITYNMQYTYLITFIKSEKNVWISKYTWPKGFQKMTFQYFTQNWGYFFQNMDNDFVFLIIKSVNDTHNYI